jgi:integrase
MDRGIFRSLAEAEKTTLHEALDRYFREIGAKKRHPYQEQQRVRQWQRTTLASRFLANLRGTDFAKYRDERRELGRAESTVRLEIQLVSHLYEIARKEWGMEGLPNPLKDIRKPGNSVERDRRLLTGEFDALLAELQRSKNPWAAPTFELAIETSLRQGMLFKIERSWIDQTGRVIHIPSSHRGAGNKVVPPYLPLSIRATAIVANLPESITGKLIGCTQNAIVVVWKRAVISARGRYLGECLKQSTTPLDNFLTGLRWHDLRHEAASRLFEKGLNPMEVASITGHKSLNMLRRYTHLQPSQLLDKIG